MTLAKLSFILFIPLLAAIFEYTYQKNAIPSRKEIVKYIKDGSIINLYVKTIGVKLKEIIGSKKFGNICLGSHEYLFYCPEQDGIPLLDIYGNFSPLGRQFKMPLKTELNNFSERVYYLTVPNKSRIYTEHISYNVFFKDVGIAPWTNIQEKDLLNSKQYLSVGRLEELLKAPNIYPTYYKQDTHWNYWGAYLALRALGLPEVKEEIHFKVDHYPHPDILGLLAALGYVVEPSDQKYLPTNYQIRGEGDEKSIARFYNEAKSNRVLVIGDSFRTSFTPIVAQYFGQVDEVHLNNYSSQNFNLSEYKYIFIIQVERYLRGQFQ
jgi:hypothetical protein